MSSNALPEQALAFYRTPARYLEFRDPGRPLCGDAGPLLRLTCGTTPDALSLPPGLASADEWQAAARFFVQQVLLAPGADNYRLLGVTPQAKDVEIKTHHRLLMRLLHPDREHTDEAWHTAAAARINQAYATLRDPEKRAEYNGQLIFDAQQARAAPGAPPAAPAPVRRPMQHSGRRQSGDTPLRRYVWRHLPQVSLAGSIVLASAWIGWIWLNNAPSAALGGGENGGTIVALQADVARPLPPVAVSLTAAESEPLRVVPPAPLPEMAPVPSTPPAQKPVTEAAVVAPVATSPRATAPNQPTVPAVPISKGTSKADAPRPPEDKGIRSAAKASAPVAQSSQQSSLDAPIATSLREPPAPPIDLAPALELRPETTLEKRPAVDPGNVIPQLALRYERGNLEQFMALFHDSARNETGGRNKIRKDYEDLFATTTSRQLIVWDLNWSPKGDRWKGDGRFQVRIQRQNENFLRLYNGTLNIEVAAEGNPPLILGIYHHVSNQSNN